MRIKPTAGTGGDPKKTRLFRDLWVMKGNLDVSLPNERQAIPDRRDCLAGDRHHDHQDGAIARAVMNFHDKAPMVHITSKNLPNSEAAMPGGSPGCCHRRIATKDAKAAIRASWDLRHAAFQSISPILANSIQSGTTQRGSGSNRWLAWPASRTFSCGHGPQYSSFFPACDTAFSLATVIASQYQDHGWYAVCYALASLVAISRMWRTALVLGRIRRFGCRFAIEKWSYAITANAGR